MRRKMWTLCALTSVGLIGLAGCGSDEAKSPSSSNTVTDATSVSTVSSGSSGTSLPDTGVVATTTGTSGGGGDAVAAGSSAFCAAALSVETAAPDTDDDESEADQSKAVIDFFQNTIMPRAEELQAIAPPALRDDLTTAISAFSTAIDTADPSKAETPAVDAATKRIDRYSVKACGWATVNVVGTEYRFTGIPATLAAGVTSFEFSNGGEEDHELVVVRENPGVSLDAKALLALPHDQAQSMVSSVGGAEALPGASDEMVADLQTGHYVYACFVPVGSVPGGAPPEGAEPHFMEGMYGEFTVA